MSTSASSTLVASPTKKFPPLPPPTTEPSSTTSADSAYMTYLSLNSATRPAPTTSSASTYTYPAVSNTTEVRPYKLPMNIRKIIRAIVTDDIETIKKFVEEDSRIVEYIDAWGNYLAMYAVSLRMFNLLSPISPLRKLRGNTALSRFKYDQKMFLFGLTQIEQNLLTVYTKFGDGVINSVLRQNVNTSAPVDSNVVHKIKQTLEEYPELMLNLKISKVPIVPLFVSKFLEIFKKVPALKEELIVYRGTTEESYITTHGNEFLSTTYDKTIADRFRKDIGQGNLGCCLLTIVLKPGVKAFWIEQISTYGYLKLAGDGEKEILVGPPYKITKEKVDDANYNIIISPYVKGARRTKKKSSKRKTTKRNPISYHSFFG